MDYFWLFHFPLQVSRQEIAGQDQKMRRQLQ
jgi:hypothetical protein